MSKKSMFGKTHPAVIAVWAAVIAASSVLPSIPLIGTGGTFSVATAIVPLTGIFFGPIAGAITASIGGFIGGLLAPHTAWLGLATFTIGTISALIAGLLAEGKWPMIIAATAIPVIGTILWFTHPIGQSAPMFPVVFYGLGIVGGLVGGVLCLKGFLKGSAAQKAVTIWCLSFAAMAGSASIANYAGLVLFQLPRELWMVLTFQAPLERAIFSVGSAIVGVPLLVGLPKIGVFVGPDIDEDLEDDE